MNEMAIGEHGGGVAPPQGLWSWIVFPPRSRASLTILRLTSSIAVRRGAATWIHECTVIAWRRYTCHPAVSDRSPSTSEFRRAEMALEAAINRADGAGTGRRDRAR